MGEPKEIGFARDSRSPLRCPAFIDKFAAFACVYAAPFVLGSPFFVQRAQRGSAISPARPVLRRSVAGDNSTEHQRRSTDTSVIHRSGREVYA